MLKPALLALLSVAVAVPAGAQDIAAQGSDDWDLGRDPANKLTIAAVSFENFGVAVRCRDTVLSVVVAGLPAGPRERVIDYSMAGSTPAATRWISAPGSASAFAVWPGVIAADLRKGGRLSMGVPDGERTRRIAVDLPASASAIDQVLSACGREIPADSSDEPSGVDLGPLVWRQSPEPRFPDRTSAAAGIAALLCKVTRTGSLRACRVESEFPEGGGFGRAATLGAHTTGRVGLKPGETGVLEDRTISFVVRYMMSEDLALQPAPSRLPASPL
jgi:hypothetical protein